MRSLIQGYNPRWKWRSRVNRLIYGQITIHLRNIAMSNALSYVILQQSMTSAAKDKSKETLGTNLIPVLSMQCILSVLCLPSQQSIPSLLSVLQISISVYTSGNDSEAIHLTDWRNSEAPNKKRFQQLRQQINSPELYSLRSLCSLRSFIDSVLEKYYAIVCT